MGDRVRTRTSRPARGEAGRRAGRRELPGPGRRPRGRLLPDRPHPRAARVRQGWCVQPTEHCADEPPLRTRRQPHDRHRGREAGQHGRTAPGRCGGSMDGATIPSRHRLCARGGPTHRPAGDRGRCGPARRVSSTGATTARSATFRTGRPRWPTDSHGPPSFSWPDVLIGERAAVGVCDSGETLSFQRADGEGWAQRRALVLDYGFEPGAEDELVALVLRVVRAPRRGGRHPPRHLHLACVAGERRAAQPRGRCRGIRRDAAGAGGAGDGGDERRVRRRRVLLTADRARA